MITAAPAGRPAAGAKPLGTAACASSPPPPAQPPARATVDPVPENPKRGWRSTASPCSTTATSSSQSDPAWFDVVRPTKLPSFEGEFGRDGHWFAGVRQSRLRGQAALPPTDLGELKTDLRVRVLRHGRRRGPDHLPTAPCVGRARPMGSGADLEPLHGSRRLPQLHRVLGAQRDGVLPKRAAAVDAVDVGAALTSGWRSSAPERAPTQPNFADRIELDNVLGRFPAPDLSARYRRADDWGHVQLAGILRRT